MNAKVDYTLLDRWRHAHAWRSRQPRDGGSAPTPRAEGPRHQPSPDEHENGPARVVHIPLAD